MGCQMKRMGFVFVLIAVTIVGIPLWYVISTQDKEGSSGGMEGLRTAPGAAETDRAAGQAEIVQLLAELPEPALPTPHNTPALLYLQLERDYPKLAERIQAQRDQLRGESTADSLEKLSDIEMFIWPGMAHEATMLDSSEALPPGHDRFLAKQVLSNRRVHKLVQELRALPESRAEAMLRARLELAFARYMELRDIKDSKNIYDTEPNVIGVDLSLSNEPDGAPRLAGAQHEVLSLLLLAGELGLEGLHGDIRSMADSLVRERKDAYARSDETWAEGQRWWFWAQTTLYNRPILQKAIMGTSMSEGEQEAFLRENGDMVMRFDLTHWDAELSPFDQMARYGIPPDYRKGKYPVSLLTGLTDEQFDSFAATGDFGS